MLPLCIHLPILDISYEWDPTTCDSFVSGCFSLHLSLKFILDMACLSTLFLFVAELPHCMHIPHLFISLLMFGLFPPSCYLNSADMNIYEYLFLISLRHVSRSGITESYGNSVELGILLSISFFFFNGGNYA